MSKVLGYVKKSIEAGKHAEYKLGDTKHAEDRKTGKCSSERSLISQELLRCRGLRMAVAS